MKKLILVSLLLASCSTLANIEEERDHKPSCYNIIMAEFGCSDGYVRNCYTADGNTLRETVAEKLEDCAKCEGTWKNGECR